VKSYMYVNVHFIGKMDVSQRKQRFREKPTERGIWSGAHEISGREGGWQSSSTSACGPRGGVRKTQSWPRSWVNFSLFWPYSHRNARANLHLLGQPNTFLARRWSAESFHRCASGLWEAGETAAGHHHPGASASGGGGGGGAGERSEWRWRDLRGDLPALPRLNGLMALHQCKARQS
jgi:hypothetical protein